MKKIVFISSISIFVFLVCVTVWLIYRDNISGVFTAIKQPTASISEVLEPMPGENNTGFNIDVPDGYALSIFSDNLSKPRVLASDKNNNIIVSDIGTNEVYVFDSSAKRKILTSNVNKPHGLEVFCYKQCYLYVADKVGVYRYDYDEESLTLSNKQEVARIPQSGRHTTKDLIIHNNKLFISVGSSCDSCLEIDPNLATVLWSNLDGSELKVYSSGLRNAVFMENRPQTDEIWTTEMGRDFLGDDLPPDELNILQENGFYGWPYCYGNNIVDTTFDSSDTAVQACKTAIPAYFNLQAHSAPLGLEFLDKNTLLVSYHGSWNRTIPTGYKIVKFELNEEGRVVSQEDFLTGWLNEKNEAIGRPVDILKVGNDVYITDDKAGVIYKLQKTK